MYPTEGTNKQSFQKAVWQFLSKALNVRTLAPWSPIPGNLSLGKKDVFEDLATGLIIAELFIILKNWKQLDFLTADTMFYKMWQIHSAL